MEQMGNVWQQLRKRLAAGQPLSEVPMPYEQDAPAEPSLGRPDCPICHGIGWVQTTMELHGKERVYPGKPCPCRIPEIQAARQARLKTFANLPHEHRSSNTEEGDYTPRTFTNLIPPKKAGHGFANASGAARRFADGEGPHILTLTGEYGSGKSHLVEAICRRALDRGVSVRYEFVPDLLDRIRATYRPDAEEQTSTVIEQYRAVDVLALDDLGAHNSTPWARSQIVSLVDARYRTGGRLVVATNLMTPQDMARDMGEGRVASRLFERSTKVCVAFMDTKDYRLGGER